MVYIMEISCMYVNLYLTNLCVDMLELVKISNNTKLTNWPYV